MSFRDPEFDRADEAVARFDGYQNELLKGASASMQCLWVAQAKSHERADLEAWS
jgi:hypothetical protein